MKHIIIMGNWSDKFIENKMRTIALENILNSIQTRLKYHGLKLEDYE